MVLRYSQARDSCSVAVQDSLLHGITIACSSTPSIFQCHNRQFSMVEYKFISGEINDIEIGGHCFIY